MTSNSSPRVVNERTFKLYDPVLDGKYDGSLSSPRNTFQWVKFFYASLSSEHKTIFMSNAVAPDIAVLDSQIDILGEAASTYIQRKISSYGDPTLIITALETQQYEEVAGFIAQLTSQRKKADVKIKIISQTAEAAKRVILESTGDSVHNIMQSFENTLGGAIAQARLTIAAVIESYGGNPSVVRDEIDEDFELIKITRNQEEALIMLTEFKFCKVEQLEHYALHPAQALDGTLRPPITDVDSIRFVRKRLSNYFADLIDVRKLIDAMPATTTWAVFVAAVQKELQQGALSLDSHGAIVEYRDLPGNSGNRKTSHYSDPPNLRTPMKINAAAASTEASLADSEPCTFWNGSVCKFKGQCQKSHTKGVDTRPEWILNKERSYSEFKEQEMKDFEEFKESKRRREN